MKLYFRKQLRRMEGEGGHLKTAQLRLRKLYREVQLNVKFYSCSR